MFVTITNVTENQKKKNNQLQNHQIKKMESVKSNILNSNIDNTIKLYLLAIFTNSQIPSIYEKIHNFTSIPENIIQEIEGGLIGITTSTIVEKDDKVQEFAKRLSKKNRGSVILNNIMQQTGLVYALKSLTVNIPTNYKIHLISIKSLIVDEIKSSINEEDEVDSKMLQYVKMKQKMEALKKKYSEKKTNWKLLEKN